MGTGLAPTTYALALANASYDWYRLAATRARKVYRTVEVVLLALAASIPVAAVAFPGSGTVPAIIGSVVVVLTGCRSIFHWQENYVRFSQAREAVEAERRGYATGVPPYDIPASKDAVLAAAISRIEQEEMRGWVKVAGSTPKS